MTVGIAGLGLIGGSMAKAIKSHTDHRVYGFDLDEGVLQEALSDGGIDGVLTGETLPECDLLLLALYPAAAVEYLRQQLGFLSRGALILDLCGVKRAVMEPIAALLKERGAARQEILYIGGHPMAGKEKSGYHNADPELFSGASMILVPSEPEGAEADPELKGAYEGALSGAEAFFLALGFEEIKLSTIEEHDRVIAFTSQLAHVVSSAYVKSPASREHYGFSAGSYKDLTRVARLNETMWTELFLDNADSLLPEVEGIIRRLSEYGDALRRRDRELLFRLLKEGRECKEGIDSYENS